MSDESSNNEGSGINPLDGPPPDDFAAPGRSVFGDDLSFDDDDDAIPHWSQPATGAVPQVGAGAGLSFDPAPPPSEADQPQGVAALTGDDHDPVWADGEPGPAVAGDNDEVDGGVDFFEFDEEAAVEQPRTGGTAPSDGPSGEIDLSQLAPLVGSGSGRDLSRAIGVGLGLAAVFLVSMSISSALTLGLVAVALTLAAVEFFNAVRVGGNHPAVLLGLTSVLLMPLAVYWRGEAALLLVIILTMVFGSLWYVLGVPTDGMLRGLGSTMLGVVYVGGLGSFAALMLAEETHGTGLLIVAVILTVAYDTGGLVFGRLLGRTPLSPASPNKTVEGLFGGMGSTVAVAVVMGLTGAPAPVAGDAFAGSGFSSVFLIGLAVAVMAPIGDLAESQIKRDLNIKDMGTILPGHGGLLDRFDGLLFALPTVWYLANALVLS